MQLSVQLGTLIMIEYWRRAIKVIIKLKWRLSPGSSLNGWYLCLHSGRKRQRYETFYCLSCLELLTFAVDHSWDAVFQRRGAERGVEICSQWAAEPPTPALDQSMLLHLQAMSGPARSTAHWRSTEENIRLPAATCSLLILPLFFFLMQLLFTLLLSFSAFYFKPHQRKFDERGFTVSGVRASLKGNLTVKRSPHSVLPNPFLCFYFCT